MKRALKSIRDVTTEAQLATALSAVEILTGDLAEQSIDPLMVATAMLMQAKQITQSISPSGEDPFKEWRKITVA